MFKNILLPTDGSNLSQAAIQKGVEFAKNIRAKITGICVMPEQKYYLYQTDIIVQVERRPSSNTNCRPTGIFPLSKRRPKRLASLARRSAKQVIIPMKRLLELLKKVDAT